MMWTRVFIIILALCILMWIPVTRMMILLVLPLGSGIDDLAFFALLGILLVHILVKLKEIHPWVRKLFEEEEKEK